jgi:putative ABC transport system permease protein
MGQKFEVAGLVSSVPDLAESAVFGEFAIISMDSYEQFGLSSGGSFLDHKYRIKFNNSSQTQEPEKHS